MFANPLGLLALLALPAIVALHLFRRRYRRRVTSALFLWGGGERTPASGRTRERLIRSPSLAAELLAALALALALAGPRCSGPRAVPHLVVVLDGSASMGVELPGGSPAARVAEALAARIDGLPRDARVTVLESGPRPTVRVGPGAPSEAALEFLADWRPAAARHDPGESITTALRLASSEAGDLEVAVELYTDRFEPARHPAIVGVHAFGQPTGNVALVAGHRRRGADGDRLSIVAANLDDAPNLRTLRIFPAGDGDGPPLLERELSLTPSQRVHLDLELPADVGAVQVALDPDALPIDDTLFLAPDVSRTVVLGSELSPEEELRLGLSGPGEPPLGRWLELVPDTRAVGAGEPVHVLVGPPGAARQAPCRLVVHSPDEGAETRSWVGPFLVESATPPLEGLSLEGVVWTGHAAAPLPGAPVIAAGGQPLATRVERSDGIDLHLDLDPARSTLQRAPDWPILLTNLVELARESLPGPRSTNLRAGEVLEWATEGPGTFAIVGPLDPGADPAVLAALTTDRPRDLRFGRIDGPGIYALEVDGERVGLLGQSFADESVSELRDRSSGERPSTADVAQVEVATDRVATWLAALALLALAGDAFFLRGRRTGAAA